MNDEQNTKADDIHGLLVEEVEKQRQFYGYNEILENEESAKSGNLS